jgi:hypothetical protein
MLQQFLVLFVCIFAATASFAKGLSPYLPLNVSPEIELMIEKAFALTQGVPLSKPYKAADLQRSIKQISDTHPQLYQQLKQYLSRFEQVRGITHKSAALSATNNADKAIPNNRNIDVSSNLEVSLGGFSFFSPYVYIATGSVWSEQADLTHFNTHLGFGYEYAQVELGYREHWFSPFVDGAMILSTHAKPSPSITISNSTAISQWKIRYEVFYSELEEVSGIVLGNQSFPGKPKLAGIHLSLVPLDNWTLGVSRVAQFGGGQRKVGFPDVIQAIFNPAGIDNVGDYQGDDPNFEFGNQLASVTSKVNFNWGMPISVYAEIGAEDTEGEKNYKLGNESFSFGLFLPMFTDKMSLRYEFNRWSTAWYVHHLYEQGYTNEGQVIGHWAGGERELSMDTPAQVHAVNLAWQLSSKQILDTTIRHIKNENESDFLYKAGVELNMRYSHATQHGFLGFELYLGRDVFNHDFGRLSGFYRW